MRTWSSSLLARKADPDAANEEGWTPLHHAAEEGNLAIVKMLLEKGADVDARTSRFGETPLMLACGLFGGGRNDAGKCARLLLEKGANANAATNDGVTPLMYAAHRGRVETVKLLLAKGAGAGSKDFKGKTALDGILEFDKIDAEGKVTVTQDSVTTPKYRTTVMGALIQHGKVNAGRWPSEEMERKAQADALNDFQIIIRLLREAVKPLLKQKTGTQVHMEERETICSGLSDMGNLLVAVSKISGRAKTATQESNCRESSCLRFKREDNGLLQKFIIRPAACASANAASPSAFCNSCRFSARAVKSPGVNAILLCSRIWINAVSN